MNTLPENPTSFAEEISHTADSVAYRRTFTDIPLAGRIFKALEQIEGTLDPREKARADSYPLITPFFESRYMMTNLEIRRCNANQVAELAAGLSPRGFIWTRNNPWGRYIEVDLPAKSKLKTKILKQIATADGLPPNLILKQGDVREKSTFSAIRKYLDDKPVIFICEGLLRYMNWTDKIVLTKNIRNILGERGGNWITPDIELLCDVNASAATQERYEKTARDWGQDVRPNLFENFDHAFSFFEELGFQVNQHCHYEIVDNLVSPKRLGLPADAVREDLLKRFTFTMSV